MQLYEAETASIILLTTVGRVIALPAMVLSGYL
jgi:hypothetical protein